jgi:prephenate dehydratase
VGHEEQADVRDAMLGILKHASFLKVLGSYPAANLSPANQDEPA